jgi:hypothetical protein
MLNEERFKPKLIREVFKLEHKLRLKENET